MAELGWAPSVRFEEGLRRYVDWLAATNGSPAVKYECKPYPYTGWCSIGAYQPGLAGAPWTDAWTLVASCQ